MAKNADIKKIAQNRRARYDYFIDEIYEAGIALKGTEVKSIRAGKINLADGYARVEADGCLLYNVHISPYEAGNRYNVDPMRPRRLLLHKREIRKLGSAVREKGHTLIPLSVYLKGHLVKVELGLARGKKLYDKREAMAKESLRRPKC